MDKSQRNALIGGVLLASAVGGAAFYYTRAQKEKAATHSSRHVSRELTLKVLKEVNGEMFGVSTNIAMIANQIKEKSRGRAVANEIKEFMLSYNPQLKNQIKKISEDTCEKYGLDEKDLRHAVEVTYADDPEVRDLVREAKTTFDKAFQGITPDLRTEIPASLTPALTLSLMTKIMKTSLFEIEKCIEQLRNRGVAISFENEEVARELQDLKLDDIRKDILVEEGLDKFNDPPLKIFQYATQKYATENPEGFNQKFMRLEMANHKAMEAVMRGAPDARIHIEAIGANLIDADSTEPLFQSAGASLLGARKANKPAIVGGKAGSKDSVVISEEDETTTINREIRKLQHEVSFQLKSSLEEAFPEELVKSAVDTVFSVFNTYNKKNNVDEPALEKVIEEVEQVAEKNGEEVVAEVSTTEVKEVPVADGTTVVETVHTETVVIEGENEVKQVEVTETVVEKQENQEEVHHENQ